MTVFFWLLVGHALADYPWQGDFLARAKNHRAPIPGIGWAWALFFHAMIHGGAVAYLTGSVPLGIAEIVVHCAIDYAKCEGWISFDFDQSLHVACKLGWTLWIR